MTILSELTEYQVLIHTIIYLLLLRKVYSLRSSKKVLEKLFDSGFWLGIFFILEPISLLLIILIYAGIYLHHKITIHTLLTPIVGFITPLIVYFSYVFWFDEIDTFKNLFYFDVNLDVELYYQNKYFWLISFIALFIILSLIIKSPKTLSVNNTFKRSWILLITNLSTIVIFLLFLPEKNGSELIFILFPVAIILANGIELIQKKILKNIILYLFLLGSIIVHYLL